ncbi:hypothetical protein AMAG_19122 [Allomyces macrogynus ATCC 38327]|uniref:ABC transporter domain-containing protein n=1 Tax=Allomyces macrogynus (strain ATCC 38327) TaxID=578462 RepID=A0A0L0SNQ3_ALLM3|nr:hypothetical protein AMAG_19122 [Allomyces macrogynus ATCC 38327]|eukprot:KNE64151.1 hypothetical protein AMAG_19122 [Allomyces macrogynus ATCC 38327]
MSWAGQLVEKRQEKLMSRTDARVEKTQEVLQGIRIIKYFAWESSFVAKLRELRNKELRALKSYWVWMTAVNVGYHAVPTLVSLLTFVTYTKIAGHDLDATTVFTCISLFNALRYPLWDLPDQIIRFFETKVSDSAATDGKNSGKETTPLLTSSDSSSTLAQQAYGSASTATLQAKFQLKNLTMTVPRGKAELSVNRVQTYLNDLDVHNYTIDTSDPSKGHGDKYIGAVSATLSWPSRKSDDAASVQDSAATDGKNSGKETTPLLTSSDSSSTLAQQAYGSASTATLQAKFQLKNLTMTVPRGKLTVILGPTGAGKSTLLHAFLGELALESGDVYMPHTPVAYVPQQAWLLNATVKENVLFGATEDPRRYKNIIKACALKRDLEILEAGDNTQYFAGKSSFVAKLRELRNKELRALKSYWVWMTAANVGYHAVPTLVSLLTFVTYTKIAGHDLDATTVFTCISLFNALRYPLWDLPDQIIRFFETKVSVNRVQTYLNDLDVHNYTIDTSDPSKGHGDKYIGAVSATLSWPSRKSDDAASAKFQLKNLTMTVPRGKLTVILGPTGAGKSTLLHAFLGELALESGDVYMPHTPVAYVPQQAWLLNATVKENVLFGATEDPRRYKNIIKACALKRDLEILEAGDNTQVGEKGIALSGGQKSRLSLARACYTDTDVVLLDDVLSAVDAPTAAHLFQQCILGELSGRTRVLVTHNVGLVAPWADHILYVKEGRIVAEADSIGTAAAQLAHAGLYAEAEMLSEVATPVSLSRANSVTTLDAAGRRRSMTAGFKGKGKAKAKVTKFIEQIMGSSSSSSSSSSPSSSDAEDSDSDEADADKPVKEHKLISDEEKAQGSVEWKVYATYIAAAGGAIWWAVLLSTLFIPQFLNAREA